MRLNSLSMTSTIPIALWKFFLNALFCCTKFCVLMKLNGAKWSQDNSKWYQLWRLTMNFRNYETIWKRVSRFHLETWLAQATQWEAFPHVKGVDKVKRKVWGLNSVPIISSKALGTDEWCSGRWLKTNTMEHSALRMKILKEGNYQEYGTILPPLISQYYRFTGLERLSNYRHSDWSWFRRCLVGRWLKVIAYEHVGSSLILIGDSSTTRTLI